MEMAPLRTARTNAFWKTGFCRVAAAGLLRRFPERLRWLSAWPSAMVAKVSGTSAAIGHFQSRPKFTVGQPSSEQEATNKCATEGCDYQTSSRRRRGEIARWRIGWGRKRLDYRAAIFRQINKERMAAHHDALEFPDGQFILLTSLEEGQEAVVLQLPTRAMNASEAEGDRRVVYAG